MTERDPSIVLLRLDDLAQWWEHLHDERMHGTGVSYRVQQGARPRPIDAKSTPEAIGPSPAPLRVEVVAAIGVIATGLLDLEDTLRGHLQQPALPRRDPRDPLTWTASPSKPLGMWQPATWALDATNDARAREHIDPRIPATIEWLNRAVPTVTDTTVLTTTDRTVTSAWRTMRLHTDLAEHVIPLPDPCPHCDTLGLLAFLDQGVIRCTNTGCRCPDEHCWCHSSKRRPDQPPHYWRHNEAAVFDAWRRLAAQLLEQRRRRAS